MYHQGGFITATTSAAALPFTGISLWWALLAGFALLALGLAVRRIAPKTQA